MKERLVLDLETQREFSEVDGRRPELLGVSVVGVYSYSKNRYDAYTEETIHQLEPRLRDAELVVGFNHIRFDFPVLQPYVSFPLDQVPVLDILDDVVKVLGHRVSLNSITTETLGHGKSGDGLEAVRWFREKRFDLIAKYCLNDVKITKEVYDYGRECGILFASNKAGVNRLEIPVYWPERKQAYSVIERMVQETKEKCLQIRLEYMDRPRPGLPATIINRHLDIYFVEPPFLEGFCHETQSIETYRLDCIVEASPTWHRFPQPRGFVPTIVTH